ncbi:MAG: GNAT family N-acetyltransferase [Vicinamibacterales bacterium]
MSDYRIRRATPEDDAVLVYHRQAMFEDMGREVDGPALDAAFRPWLHTHMRAGTYHAWLVEAQHDNDHSIVAGGGIMIIPWPPGPGYLNNRLAFVYNVYTESTHRHRGLGKLVMHAIHAFCRDEGIRMLALNASEFGMPLYQSLGYTVTPSPMMFLALD